MSRNTQQARGIRWTGVPEATSYNIHVDHNDDPDFLTKVDDGTDEAFATVPAAETEWRFPDGFPDGADIAVVAVDDNTGRFSDPHSPEGFQDIPLLATPLAAPTGGVVFYDE